MAATTMTSHCVSVNLGAAEFMAEMYDLRSAARQGFCPHRDDSPLGHCEIHSWFEKLTFDPSPNPADLFAKGRSYENHCVAHNFCRDDSRRAAFRSSVRCFRPETRHDSTDDRRARSLARGVKGTRGVGRACASSTGQESNQVVGPAHGK